MNGEKYYRGQVATVNDTRLLFSNLLGTCWGPDQMNSNGDIMGGVNRVLEGEMNVGVALFVNADAGDIDPTSATCSGMPNFQGAPIIANAVAQVWTRCGGEGCDGILTIFCGSLDRSATASRLMTA